jgi:hypothetical protein
VCPRPPEVPVYDDNCDKDTHRVHDKREQQILKLNIVLVTVIKYTFLHKKRCRNTPFSDKIVLFKSLRNCKRRNKGNFTSKSN